MTTDPVAILLVDDDRDDVTLALRALEKAGITDSICVVRDGAEALEFIFGTGAYSERSVADLPQLVILDINLPMVGGLEVLDRIRADLRTTGLPVVLLTSSQERRDVVEGYRLHANSYVVKPVDFVKFASAVGELGRYWLTLNVALPSVPGSS